MSFSNYSTTPASNTDIAGTNVGEGCAPAGLNDAIRQLMADGKELSDATPEVGQDAQAQNAFLQTLADQADVRTADLADNAITGDKIADDAVLPDGVTATTQPEATDNTTPATTEFVQRAFSAVYARGESAAIDVSGQGPVTIDGIPAGANEVVLSLQEARGALAGNFSVQLGTSAVLQVTGYSAISQQSDNAYDPPSVTTQEFLVPCGTSGISGDMVLRRLRSGSNTWIASYTLYDLGPAGGAGLVSGSGIVTLPDELTRIVLTRGLGDNFTGGEVSLKWS